MSSQSQITLTARQALIAAAIAGYKGDYISSWPCPAPKSVLLEFALSYVPHASNTELEEAFDQLTREACWTPVQYPVFAEEQYYCHYWSSFIDELPEPIELYDKATSFL